MQTYMSFSVGNETTYTDDKTGELKKKDWFNLRFIDSFGFMAFSLIVTQTRVSLFKIIVETYDNLIYAHLQKLNLKKIIFFNFYNWFTWENGYSGI